MPLSIHLSIHFLVAILVGYLAGRYFKKRSITFIAAITGGFFIDLDHVLEYFFYYGLHFNLNYFLAGREFLLSNKIHLFFHAWEYIPILFLVSYLLRKRKNLAIFILALCIAGTFHLISDVFINKYPFKFYSISYRASQNFLSVNLLSPEQYKKDLESKEYLGI
jgi:hypothetical protein